MATNVERKIFLDVVDLISIRPGMFVGTEDLRDVANYLHGLEHGLCGSPERGFTTHVFKRWLEGRFLYCRAAWNWDKLLLHSFGSDAAALAALPKLLREYFHEFDLLGEIGIEAQVSKAILSKNVKPDNQSQH